jgi:hypothetical protein
VPAPADHTVVPAGCPIGWPARDRHGHARTSRPACRPGLRHVTLMAETTLTPKEVARSGRSAFDLTRTPGLAGWRIRVARIRDGDGIDVTVCSCWRPASLQVPGRGTGRMRRGAAAAPRLNRQPEVAEMVPGTSPASTAHSRAPSARRPRPGPGGQPATGSPPNRRPPAAAPAAPVQISGRTKQVRQYAQQEAWLAGQSGHVSGELAARALRCRRLATAHANPGVG